MDRSTGISFENDQTFSSDEDLHDGMTKKMTYDSGFVDTGDENYPSIHIKREVNDDHQFHSTPLRPQYLNSQHHRRHPSISSSRSTSPTPVLKESRNNRFLGTHAVEVLNRWFQANRDYPYPDDERTEQLAHDAGITQKQVKKWFANKRVRSQTCYKPVYRSRKSSIPTLTPNPNVSTTTTTLPPLPVPSFNPMMMFMMQQHYLSTFIPTSPSPLVSVPTEPVVKPKVDTIKRFWL